MAAYYGPGTVLEPVDNTGLYNMAGLVFQKTLLEILKTTSPRAWAFALLGIYEYLQRFAGDRRANQCRRNFASGC